MKRCSKCKEEKPDEVFSWREKAHITRNSVCSECMKSYRREHYRRNPQPYKDRGVAARRALTIRFKEWLSTKSCVDCGESDPDVLECDHVRGVKTASIAKMISLYTPWSTVESELQKCEVRCANCHRKKTARERGWSRKLIATGAD